MSPGQIFALVLLLAITAIALLIVVAVVRHAPRSRAAGALGRGDFTRALTEAETGNGAGREDLLSAAQAAKHLLDLNRAGALLDRILAQDPGDGEAWLERGLVAAYAGDGELAAQAFTRAEGLRADLLEQLTLHRAWLALRAGRERQARALFEEIEAPLESKLRTDLGPGDPLFAEWFLQAAELWAAVGAAERSRWARREGLQAAPDSALVRRLGMAPAVQDSTDSPVPPV